MSTTPHTLVVSIRRMTREDVAQVHAIEQRCFTTPWPLSSYMFELEQNRAARLWVAEVQGALNGKRVAGMVVAWLLVDEVHIANIAVDYSYRRQGVACKLLATALQTCAQEGALSASLDVRANNHAAQALYRRFGFEVSGLRKAYYHDNNEDALLMNLPHLTAVHLQRVACA